MEELFCGCSSLISLPDISKWDFNKAIYIVALFCGYSSLKFLPDISKWDINKNNDSKFNIIDIILSYKEYQSKEEIYNIIRRHNLSYMFYGCSSLISLPDISKWNMENVIVISYMFYECSSLKSLPDISKWNIKSIKNLNNLFENCSLLTFAPDISK